MICPIKNLFAKNIFLGQNTNDLPNTKNPLSRKFFWAKMQMICTHKKNFSRKTKIIWVKIQMICAQKDFHENFFLWAIIQMICAQKDLSTKTIFLDQNTNDMRPKKIPREIFLGPKPGTKLMKNSSSSSSAATAEANLSPLSSASGDTVPGFLF